MKTTGMKKLIAIVSAVAILVSQFTASARFALTADEIIDSTKIGQAGMLSGFSVDSKDYAWQTQGEYGGKYGEYHPHLNWQMDRIDKNWNAEDSMNIYPIGTPDTAYYEINSEETFYAEPYAYHAGTDFQIWNGYMFVVLEKTTWAEDADGNGQGDYATFDSVIQVYDITNGKKAHVAT